MWFEMVVVLQVSLSESIRRAGLFVFGTKCGRLSSDYSYSKNVDVYYEVPGSNGKAVNGNGKKVYQKKVEFFAWEKLDYADKIKKAFKL